MGETLKQVQYIVKVMKHTKKTHVKINPTAYPDIKRVMIDEEENVYVDLKNAGQVILPQLAQTV